MASSEEMRKSTRSFTLFLIRHAEASHNVEEKAARQLAREAVIAEGMDPESPEAKERIEDARKAILVDPTFFDAPLSDSGFSQAKAAGERIRKMTSSEEGGLPEPTEVFVSPLQRTLQTADLVFPNSSNIRVREELRERLTGRPADNRESTDTIAKRYRRFSFKHLIRASGVNRTLDVQLPPAGGDTDLEAHLNERKWDCCHGSSFNSDEAIEDNEKLRVRTQKLFHLLAHSTHQSIAVITHKGYLRSLERGPLGLVDAPEFENCEVRVYKASFCEGDHELLELLGTGPLFVSRNPD